MQAEHEMMEATTGIEPVYAVLQAASAGAMGGNRQQVRRLLANDGSYYGSFPWVSGQPWGQLWVRRAA